MWYAAKLPPGNEGYLGFVFPAASTRWTAAISESGRVHQPLHTCPKLSLCQTLICSHRNSQPQPETLHADENLYRWFKYRALLFILFIIVLFSACQIAELIQKQHFLLYNVPLGCNTLLPTLPWLMYNASVFVILPNICSSLISPL